ncbi:uncharacterized protein LOC113210876 isoform X2 [Frankliniella occidentalis]|uniref:Uncharacterized protein LOC113210876 isoform X2 n=1 Tax=Frankliniella occidentalis TaxID=133901 RepID=A0A9C6XSY2_FRAOC|nr:uncharacterized protein LOC113210876 isoform X2 [Frankliniella occidentalis]
MKGLVYVHQNHTKAMNDFLIKHMIKQTGGTYLEKKELQIIKAQFVERLKTMEMDEDLVQFYGENIIQKLSNSTRNRNSHIRNRKPRLAAARAARLLSPPQRIEEPDEDESEVAERLLRSPVLNKEVVKNALRKTQERESFIRANPVTETMLRYPYLSDAELLVEDYASRKSMEVIKIKMNFELDILPLATVFSKEDCPQSELQKLQLIKEIDTYFTQNEQDWPCIKLCYDQCGGVPVSEIPRGQAPAIIAVTNDKDITSVHLVFNGGILISHKQPTAFLATALTLGSYYVFDINFPDAYMRLLKVLDCILHKTEPSSRDETDVKTFMKKMKEARRFLLNSIQ